MGEAQNSHAVTVLSGRRRCLSSLKRRTGAANNLGGEIERAEPMYGRLNRHPLNFTIFRFLK